MPLPDLVDQVRSGVVHIEYSVGGDRVTSGSGFMARGHLVTNHHVFVGPTNATVTLGWQRDPTPQSRQEIQLQYNAFAGRLVAGSPENGFDFAVLDIPQLRANGLFDFQLQAPLGKRIGDAICFLGFPLEHRNLTCHQGILSSFFRSGTANIIQLDASVNQGNSGGPLLDPDTGNVIGVVTRKGTGLSRLFDQLLAVFGQNIQALEQARGIIGIGPIDPVAAMIAGQNQMRALANEILRSANVGVGYAFSSEHVLAENVFQPGAPAP